ncbi:MAG: PKD domain-containing protein [Candidatus Bipolaricaulaceae bacterium]
MGRRLRAGTVLLASLLLAATGAAAQVRIGALQEDYTRWQQVATRAGGQGLAVTVESYSEDALYQQVYFWATFGQARVDIAEVPTRWLPQVLGRLLNLAPYTDDLQEAGLEIVAYGGQAIGVSLPWREDAFAAVLTRSPRVGEALEILPFLTEGLPTTAVVPQGITALPLQIGAITLAKPTQNMPGVDGALEMFLSAVRQTVPQGAVQALGYLPSAAREALARVANMIGLPLSAERSEVVVVLETRGAVSPLAAGAREAVSSPLGLTKAVVPLGQLESFLAQVGGQAYVRLPYEPIPLATSEGAPLVGASAFHSQGIRGSGVKVAVIDLGFRGLSTSQSRGDLPYSAVTRDFTGSGLEAGISHGTAVAEIVYDVAPQAQLYLIKIGNEVDLDNAVSYCISEGVDIINHSLGWYNTNFYDGTGTICDIARRATSAGILWVQAAGNDALRHWEGTFADGNGDSWLDTQPSFSAQSGDPITLYLTWDGWPQTGDDYDLFLYGPGGSLVASSTKTQAGTEEPTERISTTASQTGTYSIRIQRADGGVRKLELFSIYHELSPRVTSSSIPAPGNASEALSVGAVAWDDYTTGPAEDFSSRGPTGDGRAKPDLVGPDNVTTGVTPYYSPFPGTSAAAPHVTGIAALLLSEDPSLSASALRSRLLSMCTAMGDPNTYGAGRLEASPQAVALAADAGGPYAGQVGEVITFDGRGSQGPITSYQWSFGDGATGRGAVVSHAYSSPGTFTAHLTVRDGSGRSDTDTAQVTISAAPQPDLVIQDLQYSPSSPGVGQELTFQVTVRNAGSASAGTFYVRLAGSSGAREARVSSLGAGTSQTITFQITLSTTPDTFTATADIYGQVDEADEGNNTRQVQVTALAADAGGPYAGQVGEVITFDGRGSQGPITSYQWSFGDGATGRGAVVSHAYSSPGTFTAHLTVRDGSGRSDTDTAQVTISAAPQPDLVIQDLQYSPSSPGVGQQVTFHITVGNVGGAAAGSFYVRLQGAAGRQNAYLSGLAAGSSHTVTVSLPLSSSGETFTATADALGQVAEADEGNNQRQVTITAGVPPLSFSISLDRASYTVGDPVRVQVQLSRAAYVYLVELDAAGRAVLIFPSGHEPDPRLPGGTTQLPRGSYTITASEPTGSEQLVGFAADRAIPNFPTRFGSGFPILSANGPGFLSQVRSWLSANVPGGAWAEASAGFTVQPQANLPPHARFSFDPASPQPDQWITFDATASSDPDGSISEYQWSFGDGATASGDRVNKRYSAAGSYTVRLTVRDDRGATDSATKTVTVRAPANQPPQASFSFSPANPDPGQNVSFDASASADPDGTIASYQWSFGDGGSASGPTASHAYGSAGTYTVTLTVRDNQGASDTATRTVQVGAPTALPGMPAIDQPGIYVWGDPDDHWHITVAGSASWSSPRKFQVRVETPWPGTIAGLSRTPGSAPGPSVSSDKRTVVWEGTVGAGWVDLRFDVSRRNYLYLALYLDTDGDGNVRPPSADAARSLVYLRQYKVNPPLNPFVVAAPSSEDVVLPSQNFGVGKRLTGGTNWRISIRTNIQSLERAAR